MKVLADRSLVSAGYGLEDFPFFSLYFPQDLHRLVTSAGGIKKHACPGYSGVVFEQLPGVGYAEHSRILQQVIRAPPDFIRMLFHHLKMRVSIRGKHDDILPAIAFYRVEHCRNGKTTVKYHPFNLNVEAVQEDGNFLECLTVRHAAVIRKVGYRLAGGGIHRIHVADHCFGLIV